MIVKVCLITVVGLVTVILLPNVFALSYEPSDFKLKNNPVICAFEPQDDPNILNLSDKMMSLTEYAFDDWKTKLTNGERHSAWDISLIKVMRSQQNTFDSSQCNILVNYFPNPTEKINDLEPTGMTKYYTDHTASIEIYYSSYGDGYYTNALGTDEQLSKTLEHELGHAFGLSHVILSDQELQNIDNGAEDMPSIMVPYALSIGIHHYSISSSDIYQLKSLYNNQGFGGYAQTTQSSTIPQNQAPSDLSVSTDKQVYQIGETIKISGLAPTPTNSVEMSVRIKILDPNGATYLDTNWGTDSYGNYGIWLKPQDMSNAILGTYTVTVYYFNGGITQTSFSYGNNSEPVSSSSQDATQAMHQTNSTTPILASQSCGLTASRGDVTICLDSSFHSKYAWDQAFFKYDLDHNNDIKLDVATIISDLGEEEWIGGSGITMCNYVDTHLVVSSWFMKDLKWWANSEITDGDLASIMHYFYINGFGSPCQP